MAIFKIKEELNKSEEIADFFNFLIQEDREVERKLTTPEILATKIRSGLDSEILSSSIINRFKEIGIPNGQLESGQPNVMEMFVKVLSEEIVNAIQNDMRIDVAVNAGINLIANGVNSAGPVTVQGKTISPQSGNAVAR
jgi:hypothetical protein